VSEEATQSQEVRDAVANPAAPGSEAEEAAGSDAAGLTEEQRRRRAAALAEVRSFGDPVLRSRAAEVRDFDDDLAREAERMIAIMRDAMGVGLAATQLGVMRRLLVFQAGSEATPTALVNPEIEWLSSEEAIAEEGCLSLPGIAVDVERPLYARVRGLDVRGEPMLLEASGLEARVLQHEIDHLDGVLILERTEREQRKRALQALREGTTYAPPRPDEDARATDTAQSHTTPAAPGRMPPSAASPVADAPSEEATGKDSTSEQPAAA
jgi:peptide deformylase